MSKKETAPAAPVVPTEKVEMPYGPNGEKVEIEITADDKRIAQELLRHANSNAAPDVTGFMTESEKAVREAMLKAMEAGDDPLGDDEPIVLKQDEADEINAAEQAAAAATEAEPEEAAEADVTEAEATAEPQGATEPVAAEVAPTAEAPAVVPEQTPVVANLPSELDIPDPALIEVEDRNKLAAAREAAEAKIDDIDARWTKGVIDDDQRIAEMKSARRELTAAMQAEASNEAAYRQNLSTSKLHDSRVINGVVKLAAAEKTVDYGADEKARSQFDTALQVIHADPDNASKTFAEKCVAAHRVVCAMRGVSPKAAAPAPAPAPAKAATVARTAPPAPPTLRNVPAASTPNTGSTVNDQLRRLKGQDFETAWSRMSPAEKAALADTE